MSSDPNQPGQPTPPPDWKTAVENYWQALSLRINGLVQGYQQQLNWASLSSGIAAVLGVIWLGSGVYIVDEGNRGVVTRFGAYIDTTSPGPHWRLPWPMEKVKIVNVEQQRFIELGYRDSRAAAKTAIIPQESLMLTADENIVSVRLAVQYQIHNAKDYSFNLKDTEATLKQLTESVERAVIGANNMDFILTEGRSEIVAEIKRQVQAGMDAYQSGITIASVNLQDAQAPEEVQGAFEDAIRASEDKQRLINEAQAYSNEVIPKARGAASRLIQEAAAFEAEKIAKAKGETERFEQLLVEYEKNPAITRKRLYLEAKEKLYSGSNKILIESERNAAQFYLPLPQPDSSGKSLSAHSDAAASVDGQVDKNLGRKEMPVSSIRPSRSK